MNSEPEDTLNASGGYISQLGWSNTHSCARLRASGSAQLLAQNLITDFRRSAYYSGIDDNEPAQRRLNGSPIQHEHFDGTYYMEHLSTEQTIQ